MKSLISKEFSLCLHPMSVVFLSFAALVFVPNYPYEVIFFFSGLSVFFTAMAARENGDLAFTCALPVKKGEVPLARIFVTVLFQCVLLLLVAGCIAVKQTTFPVEMRVNLAANSANLAFCGFGAQLLGAFNLTFFPLYYRDPNRVGVPFLIASAVQFVLIGVMVAIRHFPFYEPIASADFACYSAKLAILLGGLALYLVMTALAARLSMMRFETVDL